MRLSGLKSKIILIGFICVNSNLVVNAATVTKGYKDVPKTHWAKDSVVKMVDEYQFMAGDPSGNFGGGRALTRYEFAKTMANMVEYYNREIETDRKDLENVVGVLEMFQSEMKKMESKVSQADEQIASQNATIAELNELLVTVGDELNGVGESGTTAEELQSLKARVSVAESNIIKLGDKGLIVDTLIKGVGNDAKHLGLAVAGVAKAITSSGSSEAKIKPARSPLMERTSVHSVDAEITSPVSETVESLIQSTESTTETVQSTIESSKSNVIDQLDGYYAAPASEEEEVEYLTPIH